MRHSSTHRYLMACAFGALVVGLAPMQLRAQSVLVAPNVVVIDGRTRTTAITLVNNGNAPTEVTLSTAFGYPVSDSVGAMRLQTFQSFADSMPSAAEFVHAYPAQFMLAPGARRIVRLLATPPEGTKDGEYWARLIVTTHAARAARDGQLVDDVGGSRIGIDLEIRSLLPLFYRQGPVTTGIAMDSLRATVDSDSIRVRVPMTRKGNAAFVGSVRAVLRDGIGTVVATSVLPLGVYFDLAPSLSLSRKGLRSGVYDLEVEAISRRPDVAQQHITQTVPVTLRTPLYLAAAQP